jgi:hypothetical protein
MRFEALAGDLLDELGYERAYEKVPLRGRAAAWTGLAMDMAWLKAGRALKVIGRG